MISEGMGQESSKDMRQEVARSGKKDKKDTAQDSCRKEAANAFMDSLVGENYLALF
jgi:hypothetical protein